MWMNARIDTLGALVSSAPRCSSCAFLSARAYALVEAYNPRRTTHASAMPTVVVISLDMCPVSICTTGMKLNGLKRRSAPNTFSIAL